MSGISRRNFINGTLVTAGSSVLGGCANGASNIPYPPSLTGLRGSHPGSNTHAHAKAWTKKSDWGTATSIKEKYDLIVVGGGISGLSAAYFYQKKHGRNKKILILDNHDDFGGHARRNEHEVNGRTLITYGGSQSIVEPAYAGETVLSMFNDIGVDLKRFDTAYDRSFYKKHNLGAVTYFSKKAFGEDKVVRHPYCNYPNYIEGLMPGKLSNAEAAAQAPLSKKGREQLLRVLNGGIHKIEIPKRKLKDYIYSNSYFDYLKTTLSVDDPGVLKMARHTALDWALTGTDQMSIGSAKASGAMGFKFKAVYDEKNPYIYHFPDGNAGVARALVKKMIPEVGKGSNAEELILSKFDYRKLDKASNSLRIRLSSTVVDTWHEGKPEKAGSVYVNYINNNMLYKVKAANVVMACYNMMIPHIVTGLPEQQAAALKLQAKSPLQYSSLGLKNWRALKEMEIGLAMSPGNMHQAVFMDFPVSMGGYKYTSSPDQPCVLQMISCPYGTIGTPQINQYKEARLEMLSLKFKDYEEEIRSHLRGMLPKNLFNFDRDVQSVTVNRWAHGYSVGGPGNSTKQGRQPFGRITIANCDSAASAAAKSAIEMAFRAVNELS
jgi:spermidine dehydrogenase